MSEHIGSFSIRRVSPSVLAQALSFDAGERGIIRAYIPVNEVNNWHSTLSQHVLHKIYIFCPATKLPGGQSKTSIFRIANYTPITHQLYIYQFSLKSVENLYEYNDYFPIITTRKINNIIYKWYC